MTIVQTRAALLVVATLIALLLVTARRAEAAISSQLDVGSTGADVVALQTYLATDATLYPEALVTGYYGPLTEAAVMRFQARYGIEQVGRVGPITRAKLNEVMGVGGTPLPPNTGGDVYAPIMSRGTISVQSTSATFEWVTNEPARHTVMYSTVWPFFYATAPYVVSASGGTAASVTLTGLQPNTMYHYVRESVDAFGNVMWTSHESFTTSSH